MGLECLHAPPATTPKLHEATQRPLGLDRLHLLHFETFSPFGDTQGLVGLSVFAPFGEDTRRPTQLGVSSRSASEDTRSSYGLDCLEGTFLKTCRRKDDTESLSV